MLAGGFVVEATDGAARAGTWRTRDGSMATPCLMLYSRRGSLLNLAPDLRDSLKPEASGVAMSAVQL
jgi:queuine/archaeosine tRNA-ribosyltransferase